jgi:hypothetical protein
MICIGSGERSSCDIRQDMAIMALNVVLIAFGRPHRSDTRHMPGIDQRGQYFPVTPRRKCREGRPAIIDAAEMAVKFPPENQEEECRPTRRQMSKQYDAAGYSLGSTTGS